MLKNDKLRQIVDLKIFEGKPRIKCMTFTCSIILKDIYFFLF